jgi:hypothetical protein
VILFYNYIKYKLLNPVYLTIILINFVKVLITKNERKNDDAFLSKNLKGPGHRPIGS